MDKAILIGLNGHAAQFRLEVDAHRRLESYLDDASARLHDDPDRVEILGDLERSLGDKLSAMLDRGDRTFGVADIDAVIDEIGAIDTGKPPPAAPLTGAKPRRRLQRIRQGQEVAGVCTGLSAYSEIDVDWIRTLFILGSLVTAGILALVYIAMAFILPIADLPEAA